MIKSTELLQDTDLSHSIVRDSVLCQGHGELFQRHNRIGILLVSGPKHGSIGSWNLPSFYDTLWLNDRQFEGVLVGNVWERWSSLSKQNYNPYRCLFLPTPRRLSMILTAWPRTGHLGSLWATFHDSNLPTTGTKLRNRRTWNTLTKSSRTIFRCVEREHGLFVQDSSSWHLFNVHLLYKVEYKIFLFRQLKLICNKKNNCVFTIRINRRVQLKY